MKHVELQQFLLCAENKYGKVLTHFQANRRPRTDEEQQLVEQLGILQPGDVITIQPFSGKIHTIIYE